ncbi:HAD hydrolase family protein [Paenibacillus flagellatus]|uniref:Sucrose phosphatase-like domain-containing protein n=1 Tax=Paenibacillus flagellatus TaxID=2211139 RepID=A0A2V5L0Z4_9BACL|nr:HAD hydrolase family protein [Paenibacillus flagellatus]PYI56326.1 hypothetical protein DLM86_04930 [Paenibacillus flagellatus]
MVGNDRSRADADAYSNADAGGLPKLFVFDLDGTALGGTNRPYARLPGTLCRLLDELAANGCAWATDTTWDVKPQMQLVHASDVASRPAYLIGGAGLQLCAVNGDECVPVQPYTDTMNARLEEAVRKELRPFMQELCGTFAARSFSFNGFWFAMTAADESAEALMNAVERKAREASGLTIVRVPEENRFYAHPAFLRKGTGLRALLEAGGFRPEDVVVAGDEEMDLDMMRPELAKHVICPSNAHPEVKRRVAEMNGVVGGKPYGDGVVEAFRALAEARGWTLQGG